MQVSKRLVGAATVLAAVAIVMAVLAPASLATKAKPSVSLRATPITLKVGQTVTFTGAVKHAVAGQRTVKLWVIGTKKATVKARATISGTGAFKITANAAKAGPVTLRVTYRVGATTFKSNKVTVTITS